MIWYGQKFLYSCKILCSHSSPAEDSIILRCDTVSLDEWFTVFGRYYNALKHQELLIQPRSVILLTTLIFLGVAMANYNEKFVTFVQEREVLYYMKKEYNRNTMHSFRGKYSHFTLSIRLGNHTPTCSGTESKSIWYLAYTKPFLRPESTITSK